MPPKVTIKKPSVAAGARAKTALAPRVMWRKAATAIAPTLSGALTPSAVALTPVTTAVSTYNIASMVPAEYHDVELRKYHRMTKTLYPDQWAYWTKERSQVFNPDTNWLLMVVLDKRVTAAQEGGQEFPSIDDGTLVLVRVADNQPQVFTVVAKEFDAKRATGVLVVAPV